MRDESPLAREPDYFSGPAISCHGAADKQGCCLQAAPSMSALIASVYILCEAACSLQGGC